MPGNYLIDGGSHIDTPLTNLTVAAFYGGADDYVASRLFPMAPVGRQSDGYWVIDPDSWLRIPDTSRAPTTPAKQSEWKASTDTYFARNYAQRTKFALETIANADQALRVRETSAMFVMEILARDRERRVANQVSSISNVGSGVALAGADKFSDYVGSDPIGTVNTGTAFIRNKTGIVPNTMVFDYDTAEVLRHHPDLRDYIKYTEMGPLTDAQLASIFRVQNVLVARGIMNNAKEGATASMTNIWGNVAILAYVAPSVMAMMTKTAGISFTWRPEGFPGPMAVERYRDADPSAKSEWVEAQYFADEKIVARDLIYSITSTI